MKNYTSKKGFTLVEIMIVVVIIGLLAAIAIPAFQRVRQTSRENAITNNLRQIGGAANQYFLDEGSSTADITKLVGQGLFIATVNQVAGESYGSGVGDLENSDTGDAYAPSEGNFNDLNEGDWAIDEVDDNYIFAVDVAGRQDDDPALKYTF
ncbi:MAG: prepilin-type N-terminal cleavage/methylation domain-containing protein [Opitutales bacterium]|nr:prepilin-type N-terminal cleavage/methylation domain-containing protein [Opitutales bacterium]